MENVWEPGKGLPTMTQFRGNDVAHLTQISHINYSEISFVPLDIF